MAKSDWVKWELKMGNLNIRKFRLARTWSNSELRKFASLFTGEIINVSAGENVDKEGDSYDNYFCNASSFYLSNYQPDSYRGYKGRPNELLVDLEQVLSREIEGRFDVVFNHTTLEHIFDINTAFKNICLMSKDIVIIVVPFVQEQHETESYLDFWRFTPTCIRKLFQINGLKVLYESANNDSNSATYLFFVATRNPEKWVSRFPPYKKLETAGNWIGVEGKLKIIQYESHETRNTRNPER